jgi:murein DD-endopeptidase MepM/ murein hydrolase activator NlpD
MRKAVSVSVVALFAPFMVVGMAAARPAVRPDVLFAPPVSTVPYSNCGYNVKTCVNKTRYHTGIDYTKPTSGSLAVAASNHGTVAYLETLSGNDMGMGTNVILEHELESGKKVYTSYSHLASLAPGLSVGDRVAKGQTLGIMGGSGNGLPNEWVVHLHFEIKDRPVTHNPSGSGTYWGYMPGDADGYGYHDPGAYIGIVAVKPPPTPVAITLTSPNRGALGRGSRIKVTWSTQGANPGDTISVYLKRDSSAGLEFPDGVSFARLADAERNDGSFKTSVPIAIALARDWRLYVKHNASGAMDASDATLRVKR